MGRQSARLMNRSKDHKDIFFNGHYHKQMWITDKDANPTLLWEKLEDKNPILTLIVQDTMFSDFETPAIEYEMGIYELGEVWLNILGEITVDWGDGTKSRFSKENSQENLKYPNHVYNTHDLIEYEVKIYGEISSIIGIYKSMSCITEVYSALPLMEDRVNSKSFVSIFARSYSLKRISRNIFDNYKNIDGINFGSAFSYTAIEEPPPGLFDSMTNVSASNLFLNSKLRIIASGLLMNATFVRTDDFMTNCENLEEMYDWFVGVKPPLMKDFPNLRIVDLIFKDIDNFASSFANCYNLEYIPEYLFSGCPNVKTFYRTFSICTNLKSRVPELWLRSNVENHASCFAMCENVENYADIPDDWK